MITYAKLRDLHTTPLGSAADDYRSAGTKLHAAGKDYKTHVVTPIDANHIWRGGGRSHAETVVRVERLAFSTSGARLRTVATTLDTLESELRAAKHEAAGVVKAAHDSGYHVDHDGGITRDSTQSSPTNGYSGGVDWTGVYNDQEASRLSAKLQVAIRRARRADTTCNKLLDTIVSADFVTTSTAQPGILERARNANESARSAELYAGLLAGLLHAAHTKDAKGTDNQEYGYPDTVIGFGKGVWGTTKNTINDAIGLVGLLALAACGDAAAESAVKAIPSNVWKQLSSKEGWKDLFAWKDLEEGRPGEFLGKNYPMLLALTGAGSKGTKLLGTARRGHVPEIRNPHTGDLIDTTKTSESIVRHSWHKHAIKQGEFPDASSPEDLAAIAKDTIEHGEAKVLKDGRAAYWKDDTVVVLCPHQRDGEAGSVFRPADGKTYFDELE